MAQANATARGIIIADGDEIKKLFRDSSRQEIADFGRDLMSDYDRVILHLGRSGSFSRGGLFFYRTSKRNLESFSQIIKDSGGELYLWMLDSFGADAFLEIYAEYKAIVDENLRFLADLNILFDGVVIDLEWINLPKGDNGQRLIEILQYIRSGIPDKRVMTFAPLIDNAEENRKRGYDELRLAEMGGIPIPMLYLVDAGFYLENDRLVSYFRQPRFSQVRDYYEEKGYPVAVSVVGGIVIVRKGKPYFIRSMAGTGAPFFKYLQFIEKTDFGSSTVQSFRAERDFTLARDDRTNQEIRKNEMVYLVEFNSEMLKQDDFIWRYFFLH